MNNAVKLGGGVLVGVLALAAVGMVPSTMYIERSIEIEAAPEAVYAQIIHVERAQGWSPWKAADPTLTVTLGDTLEGVGASYSWTSQDSGDGTLTVEQAEPYTRIQNAVVFDGRGGGTAVWQLQPEGNRTLATWSMTGDAPLVVALVADRLMGPTFEDGLVRIKAQAEAWQGDPG